MSDAYTLILPLLGAAAAGLVGAFALMKRTVLAGDVMSHIAIPGLGLAVMWKIHPLLGGGLTLLAGILLIWKLQQRSELSTEAAIGVLFASSVALGALLINSSEELIDALFGGFDALSTGEFAFGIAISLGILVTLWFLRHKLIIGLFSPELAATSGINVERINLWFLLLFGLAILTSLRFLGALLVGSLIIIPASAARQLTHTLGRFLIASVVLSMLSVIVGFFIANTYHLDPGPMVVVTASAFFVLSLFKKKK